MVRRRVADASATAATAATVGTDASSASVPSVDVLHDPAGDSALFRHHYQPMLRLACAVLGDRMAAEDAVQDAFAGVAGRLAERAADEQVRYLRAAVMNACLKAKRRDRAVKRQPVATRETVASVEDRAVASDDRRRMNDALDELSVRQRECVVLRYYAELTDVEIAATLGVSVGSAKTHLRRGLLALKKQLEVTR